MLNKHSCCCCIETTWRALYIPTITSFCLQINNGHGYCNSSVISIILTLLFGEFFYNYQMYFFEFTRYLCWKLDACAISNTLVELNNLAYLPQKIIKKSLSSDSFGHLAYGSNSPRPLNISVCKMIRYDPPTARKMSVLKQFPTLPITTFIYQANRFECLCDMLVIDLEGYRPCDIHFWDSP